MSQTRPKSDPLFNAWRLARRRGSLLRYIVATLMGVVVCFGGRIAPDLKAADTSFTQPNPQFSIAIEATAATRWRQGSYEVLHLLGPVKIDQQTIVAAGNEAILWVETPDREPDEDGNGQYKVIVYLEGQVTIDVNRNASQLGADQPASDRIVDDIWLGRFFTSSTVDLNQKSTMLDPDVQTRPEIFARAQARLAEGAQTSVQAVQFQSPQSAPLLISPQTGAIQNVPQNFRSVIPPAPITNSLPPLSESPSIGGFVSPQAAARQQGGFSSPSSALPSQSSSPFSAEISARDSSVALNIKSFTNPNNPNERVSIGTGGVRIVVDSPELADPRFASGGSSSQIAILADNVVQWQTTMTDGSQRQQMFIEGDVVFAKGKQVIYAEQMYYDVERQQGTILNAEVLTPVPEYRGLVRLKAKVVQQVDANNLRAFGSAFTSSRLGVPRYWLQSETIDINRQTVAATDPSTGQTYFDPQTGQPASEDQYTVDAQANRVYLAGVPVFAWPRLRTTLDDPSIYLKRFGVNNDNVLGFQLTTGWDMYQLLGLNNPPAGTEWIGLLDYLSERGVGFGSEFEYQRDGLFGIPGNVKGTYKSWFINDSGLDTLGQDRVNLVPEEDFRGRIIANHRHDFGPGFRLRAELGYISDRNFLEQFYEREWDNQKDATTGLWLERNVGSVSDNLTTDIQINDFFTQTTWLPRYDRFRIGQSLFGNRAVWHNHSHIGYANMDVASTPINATEQAKFDPLAWEANVDGIRAGTRQQLDFPFQAGPVKVVPYVLGDVTYWQEDLNGNDLTRLYGQTGVRASLPMWRVDPSIQSVLWNVNGLAHKVTFDVDMFFADASENLEDLALYDPLDDDAQEHFRRRFAFDTFGILPGGNTPLKFDERFYALRSGMQSNVTAPSSEIADDLAVVKMGVRQRWQTKRGMPGQERIIDWMTLDAQTTLFPNADRDNFGQELGMFDYDFRWHLGDRFSVLSDGYADLFGDGLRTVSLGANLSRPESGDLYLGVRSIEGPISSNLITAAMTYRMSEKWGVKGGGQVDFGEAGSIGQSLDVVYIGESFLWQAGFNYDVTRDNLGFRFGFEPRFVPKPKLFRPGGSAIPPAGSRWLE